MAHEYTTCAENFASSLLKAFDCSDIDELKKLYLDLSEEENISKAKEICSAIYKITLNQILSTIKCKQTSQLNRYYAWHFLQLVTSCGEVKTAIQDDFDLLPALMVLHTCEFDDLKYLESLQTVSLNYLIMMLGGAEDMYYDHVASSGIFSLIHNMLELSTLSSNDSSIEALILSLNLLLEGTSSCKKQLIDLDFERLLAKKIKDRTNCEVNLLKVAQMTYQKLLLLRSDSQTFVETFRKGFQEEAKKQEIYQELRCYNRDCNIPYSSLFKKCSKCKVAMYCGKECQIKDWKGGHSKICTPPSIDS